MIIQKIDDLISRYYEKKCTPKEEVIINNFLNSYQNNDGEWDEELNGNQKEIESLLYSKITKKINPPVKKQNNPFKWWYRSAAALLIILSSIFIFTKVSNEQPVKEKEKTEALVVRNITKGQKSVLHLIDGTVIYINSDSKISYPKKFTDNKREIYLDGEAYFEVSHDPERPFIVHTGLLDIKVLGTSFNINTYYEKITVTLESGKVYIQNTNPVLDNPNLGMLNPNQQFVYDKTDNSILVNEVDVDPYIAWTKKQLVFREEPIYLVIKKLEKWYDVEFTFRNNDIKNCIFTGTFENESLQLVLESLHNVAGINHKIDGKEIELSGSGCSKK